MHAGGEGLLQGVSIAICRCPSAGVEREVSQAHLMCNIVKDWDGTAVTFSK